VGAWALGLILPIPGAIHRLKPEHWLDS